ncbi:MAG: glycosyltransferase [Candidatus Dependentiae bacterium]|nr:glycosyltransferase [Candidatus Dependentiae bacterium]
MTKNKIGAFIFRFFTTILLSSSFIVPAQKICILIPAYNEQDRIGKTLCAYADYFKNKPEKVKFLVVANGCNKDDKTVQISQALKKTYKNIDVINLENGGKGYALKNGFLWALKKKFDLIGFVDADMATLPEHFYDLIEACNQGYDGANASRYAKGAKIYPERPLIRLIGGKLYNWVLRKRFGFTCKDTQCGAKIFTRDTIAKVAPQMEETGWSWELEFFYLCQLEGKKIKEVPTVWSDQPGSHLEISTKIIKEFTSAPGRIKQRHAAKRKALHNALKKEKRLSKINKKSRSF